MSRATRRAVQDLNRRAEKITVPKRVEDQFSKYRDDPVGFCVDILRAKSATRRSDGSEYQFEILQDLAEHELVTVRSGRGAGKSAIDGWAVLWWLCTRPLSRVGVVAPEFARQVRAVLFAEIRKWARRAKVPLPVTVLASRLMVEGFGEEWSALGMPATEPDRIEGLHSEAGVLLILDETKGIPQPAYDALQGALTGLEANRLLVTSTPGGPSGPFYRMWSRGDGWRKHHVPSTDSSNVSPAWVEDRAKDWGKNSPLCQAHVLGEFPDAGDGVLFPLSLLEAAQGREIDTKDAKVCLGVDVARSIAGDKNAIAFARGGKVEGVTKWNSPDTMKTVSRVIHEAATRNAERIRVDVGGVGAGTVDRLKQLRYKVEGVHFGGGADDPRRFANKRAEMFWRLRERMEQGEINLPENDDDLIADLSAMRYVFTQAGKIQLESKDETKKRIGRSPDGGDAVALAVGTSKAASRKVTTEYFRSDGWLF